MSKTRLDLHAELKTVSGLANLYFSPPETLKIVYPCIVYDLNNVDQKFANNSLYKDMNRYDITIISKDPDNDVASKIRTSFPLCRFDRRFISENLVHDVLVLYY